MYVYVCMAPFQYEEWGLTSKITGFAVLFKHQYMGRYVRNIDGGKHGILMGIWRYIGDMMKLGGQNQQNLEEVFQIPGSQLGLQPSKMRSNHHISHLFLGRVCLNDDRGYSQPFTRVLPEQPWPFRVRSARGFGL